MKFSNFHTHCFFCDGSAHPEEYVEEAIHQGMEVLGFSSHAPVFFKNGWSIKSEKLNDYCECIRNVQKENKHDIEVLLALEADYIPGFTNSFKFFRTRQKVDYIIGSVHLVNNGSKLWFIDGPKKEYINGLKNVFDDDIRHAVESYFSQVEKMIINEKPDIIGHLDKIKMHNEDIFFSEDEQWYQNAVMKLLQTIKKNKTIVEVNTRGIYKKKTDSLFPSKMILKKCYNLDIPMVVSSDAHQPKELTSYFKETYVILKDIGYKTIKQFRNKEWIDVSL